MSNYLRVGQANTPLYVFNPESYFSWLTAQNQQTQNWITSTCFSGKGLAVIPNNNGGLEAAVFIVENTSEYFACGELANLLPNGDYQLVVDADQEAICFGFLIGTYQFERYKEKQSDFPTLFVGEQSLVDTVSNLVSATSLVRDLVTTPAADMMPEHLSSTAQTLVDRFNGSVSEIVGEELLNENYPTIHAVGRASVHKPRLIDLRWGDANAPKLTLVGKGVCFDSGGLDIKPSAGMRLMKKDMGGAAHVLGLAELIMASELSVNLRVLIPAVENAVSSNAFRPGDVIKTRKGLHVEIDNTDAEGRLVLCDALDEAVNDKPELIIDFATLTGAMRVALGTELPGFFATKDETALGIQTAGEPIQDPVWRMPLHKPYKDLIKSDIADLSNCASGPFGGAITAALYLQAFLPEDVDWVHFDIMAYNNRKLSGRPVGGEAFGIRAVFSYLQARFG
ncbi:MAG: leucyl aminopeptidase family protein [Thalassotalea sp.]|nr:leucyl aminopeptidase family protein [Thalassotalea sp.]